MKCHCAEQFIVCLAAIGVSWLLLKRAELDFCSPEIVKCEAKCTAGNYVHSQISLW